MVVTSPISRRRNCTDMPCLVLFAGFLAGWVVIAGIAVSKGSIKRFNMPSDSNDNICGVDKGFEKRPYLLFFDLTKCAYPTVAIFGCPTPQMCIEKCPSSYFFGAVPALLTKTELDRRIAVKLKASLRYCLPGVNRTRLSYARLVDGYHCAPWYTDSTPVAGRCLPGNVESAATQLKYLSREMHQQLSGSEARLLSQPTRRIHLVVAPRTNGTTSGPATSRTNTTQSDSVTLSGKPETSEGESITKRVLRAASDTVRQTRFIGVYLPSLMCASLVTPLALTVVFVLLLRCFITPVVVLMLTAVAVGLTCITVLCAHHYEDLRNTTGLVQKVQEPEKDDPPLRERPGLWLGLTVAAGCLLLVYLLLVVALRRRLVLAVVILEQCSAAIGDMLTLVLVPVLSFSLQLLVCLVFMLVLVFLFGSRHQWRVFGECRGCDLYATGDSCYPADFAARCSQICPNATCGSTQDLTLYAYNMFALIWGVCFVAAINQIAVAIAFSTWYFSNSKRLNLTLPLRAYVLALTFHSGTAAFGSLLMAVVKVVLASLTWIKSRLTKRGGWLASSLLSCCQCCFWCVDNFIRFINRRAYIVTALESVGLCAAGRNGVEVVARNLARVAVADTITALVLWLGRLLVVAASVMLCHWLLATTLSEPVPRLLPAIFTGTIAYAVSGTTFSVFAMGVDTIFYCAMVDLDENDGSSERPYAMSRSLGKALGVASDPPPPPATTVERPPMTEPPPLGPTPSDFWTERKWQPGPGTFIHPGEVERPLTPATPFPGVPKGR